MATCKDLVSELRERERDRERALLFRERNGSLENEREIRFKNFQASTKTFEG